MTRDREGGAQHTSGKRKKEKRGYIWKSNYEISERRYISKNGGVGGCLAKAYLHWTFVGPFSGEQNMLDIVPIHTLF